MTDLYGGSALVVLFCVTLFLAGSHLSRRLSVGAASILVMTTVAVLLAFILFVQDRLLLTRLAPFDNALILANPLLPLAGLLAGLILPQMPENSSVTRRILPVGLLLGLGMVYNFRPLLGTPPLIENDQWQNGVCMQSSEASCSVASAATLLRAHGINASEAEMARLCLTRSDGTSMLGVYRGLRRKTAGTPWRVGVLSRANLDTLRRATQDGPVVLSVGLDRFAHGVDPRYQSQWGWTPGLRHAVVLFRFLPNNKIEMGDPSVGREQWNTESLSVLWHGEGIRLIPR